jgi:hypothetical protein
MNKINIIFIDNWTRESVINDPQYIYIFTDNLSRTSGKNEGEMFNNWYAEYWAGPWYCYPNTTQAVIRGLHNAFPITTMRDPYKHQLEDKDFELIRNTWEKECSMIREASKNYLGVKCSPYQFGNGTYSRLTPLLFNALSWFLWEYLGIDNSGPILKLI